jgi:hypothetical protein
MKAQNEKILAEAREERAKILVEAKDTKNSISMKPAKKQKRKHPKL